MSSSTEIQADLRDKFTALEGLFSKVDRLKNEVEKKACLDNISKDIEECKRLLKSYEREARLEEMDNEKLVNNKADLVRELQTFVGLKKLAISEMNRVRAENTSAVVQNPFDIERPKVEEFMPKSMTNKDMIDRGKKWMNETDASLERSRRVVEQTKQVGAETAAALHEQTATMERVVNKLDEIQFNLKKSSRLIRHLTRSMATDRCFQMLLGLIGLGVILIIILKFTGKDKGTVVLPGEEERSNT